MMVVIALINIITSRNNINLQKEDLIFLFCFLTYPLIVLLETIFLNIEMREFESYSRLILVVPIYFILSRNYQISIILFISMALGAITIGIYSLGQLIFEVELFRSFIHPGMLSLFSSILGLSLLFLVRKTNKIITNLLFIISGLAGIISMFLSGGRGVWIAALCTLLIILIANPYNLPRRVKIIPILLFFILGLSIFFMPNSNMSKKIDHIVTGVQEYISHQHDSDLTMGESVITRFAMWESAIKIARNNLLFGVGENNYQKNLMKLIEKGEAPEFIGKFKHPHNQFLSTLVQHGLLGLMPLLILLTYPIYFSLKNIRNKDMSENNRYRFQTNLILLIVSSHYFFYSFTSAIFAHQTMALFYAFMISSLTGMIMNKRTL